MLQSLRAKLQQFWPRAPQRDATAVGFETELDAISEEVDAITLGHNNGRMTILQGPSFSIYAPSYALDRLLYESLRLRGVAVVPIYCDAVQRVECNFYGGVWSGGNTFAKNCQFCVAMSQRLWQRSQTPAIRLSSYVTEADKVTASEQVAALADGEWLSYSENGMPLGRWAKDILVNNWVVGDYRLIPDYVRLGRAHLENLLLLDKAYGRILDDVQPDRVIANDSYYGMWAILAGHCQEQRIPFYSHWPINQTRVAFAANDAVMNLDFHAPWPAFSAQQLAAEHQAKVDAWLANQTGVRGSLIDTASVLAHQDEVFDLAELDLSKPTALMPANVIWDLAALNKQVIFADMIEWIVQTIRWFEERPHYQLIVKAHPAEQNPTIPETRERIEVALRDRGVKIPKNVLLLSPKVDVTVYDLLPLVKVGVVHTTSVGFEMAAYGLPVITTGRGPYRGFGFTFDPTSPDEYFGTLETVLAGGAREDRAQQIDLAYKFILFYQFHYYTRLGLFESEWGKPPVIKIKSAQELLPGRNPHLDYIVDSIMQGAAIVSETRWPPMS